MLLTCPVEPGVVKKVLGAIEAASVGEEKKIGRNERRGVVAVRGDDVGDSFPAGITVYLKNGGLLEHAQQMAGHESARTTKLYDRRSDKVTLDEVEKIML
jgi:hypothetical protein